MSQLEGFQMLDDTDDDKFQWAKGTNSLEADFRSILEQYDETRKKAVEYNMLRDDGPIEQSKTFDDSSSEKDKDHLSFVAKDACAIVDDVNEHSEKIRVQPKTLEQSQGESIETINEDLSPKVHTLLDQLNETVTGEDIDIPAFLSVIAKNVLIPTSVLALASYITIHWSDVN